jgi:hypothetical protein
MNDYNATIWQCLKSLYRSILCRLPIKSDLGETERNRSFWHLEQGSSYVEKLSHPIFLKIKSNILYSLLSCAHEINR